jgi:hypothetical protein
MRFLDKLRLSPPCRVCAVICALMSAWPPGSNRRSSLNLLAMAGAFRALLRSLEVPGCDPRTAPWGALAGDPVCEFQGPIWGNEAELKARKSVMAVRCKTKRVAVTSKKLQGASFSIVSLKPVFPLRVFRIVFHICLPSDARLFAY